MRTTTVPFDLLAWSHRMGARRGRDHLTLAEAADLLGMSLAGYKAAERRCRTRPGQPCNKTLALLAQALERLP